LNIPAAGEESLVMRAEMPDSSAEVNDPSDHYHVVCHDCTCEKLIDDPAAAERVAAAHETATGHRVEVGVLSPR
jgi:Fe2+ or Zn2+ uptake regulation protein